MLKQFIALSSVCVLIVAAGGVAEARHWFTQPMSRLVVNPTMDTPAPPGLPEPALPLHAAYYAGEKPARLPFLWGFLEADRSAPDDIVRATGAPTFHSLGSRRDAYVYWDGGTHSGVDTVSLETVFDGPNGLIQTIGGMARAPVIITGIAPEGGRPVWDSRRHTVTWSTAKMAFALAIPGGRGLPVHNPRTWAVALPSDFALNVVISARFAVQPDDMDALARTAARRATRTAFVAAREAGRKAWDKRMVRIPHPTDFTLRILDPMGATPEAIRHRYEEAWAFILSDTLPSMPENGFPYPQLACGKPSLWSEGHPKARASAQWESILGIQYLAAVDPETAWRAFEGLMSLVDKDGSMGGEGLPSRHAETAWMLYSRTRDAGRLRAAYPAIKRLLQWKARDPRWIFMGATQPSVKDSEFVSSAILDMGYAMKITDALKLPADTSYWKREQTQLAADFRRWFWEEPGGDPYEWVDTKTGKRWGKNSPWNLESLALPLPLLGDSQRDSLLRLFQSERDDDKPFLISNLSKQPNLSLTRIGLTLHGKPSEADAVAEAQMRDITLADDFAETYDQQRPLHGTGVRPSLFGALNIIDGVLFHNGMTVSGRDG